MKKLLLLLLCLPMIGVGQDSQRSFSLAGLIGTSYGNKLTGQTKYMDEDYYNGIVSGLSLDYTLSKRFSLNTKLLYYVKGEGVKLEHESLTSKVNIHNDLHYLTIPLLAQINWKTNNNKWTFYLNTGIFAAYLLKYNEVVEQEVTNFIGVVFWDGYEYTVGNVDRTNDVSRFDLGLAMGYGVQRNFNKFNILLDVGGNWGFVDLKIPEVKQKLTTSSMHILFGVSYDL